MKCGQWSEKDWKTLILTLKKKNCVLMLGPDAAIDEETKRPLTEILANKLAENEKIAEINNISTINTSNLAQVSLYYNMKIGRNDLEEEVKSFYEDWKEKYNKIYQEVAALPFYLAITSSPDDMFLNALKNTGKRPKKEYYNFKGGNTREVVGVSISRADLTMPLIYHLYGIVEDSESLVLSEDDYLEFLVNVVSGKPKLPSDILSEIQSRDKSLLFLGFGFRHWILRILLHILNVRRKESRSFALEKFSETNIVDFQSTVFFYSESDYRIQICNQDLISFVKELRERYEATSGMTIVDGSMQLADGPSVFICHASEDKEYAASLYAKLGELGCKPWLDKESLVIGKWDPQIEKAINSVDYFLVLSSIALNKKKIGYVNSEIELALKRQSEFRGLSFIIPLISDSSGLPEELKPFQGVDLRDDKSVDKLFSLIKRDQQLRKE